MVAMAVVMVIARHYGPEQPRTQPLVLDHLLVRSLIRLYRSLIRLLTRSFSHSRGFGKVND